MNRLRERTTIEIDIDVHRAIEARRTGFQESQNDILRKVFGLMNDTSPSVPQVRRTGKFAFSLYGKRNKAGSLKEVYLLCLQALATLEPNFLENLATKSTRARRIVARKPEELFIKNPSLAEKFAKPLCGEWWVDTNLSRQQCEKRLRIACDVAQIRFGQDLVLEFPDRLQPS